MGRNRSFFHSGESLIAFYTLPIKYCLLCSKQIQATLKFQALILFCSNVYNISEKSLLLLINHEKKQDIVC